MNMIQSNMIQFASICIDLHQFASHWCLLTLLHVGMVGMLCVAQDLKVWNGGGRAAFLQAVKLSQPDIVGSNMIQFDGQIHIDFNPGLVMKHRFTSIHRFRLVHQEIDVCGQRCVGRAQCAAKCISKRGYSLDPKFLLESQGPWHFPPPRFLT